MDKNKKGKDVMGHKPLGATKLSPDLQPLLVKAGLAAYLQGRRRFGISR